MTPTPPARQCSNGHAEMEKEDANLLGTADAFFDGVGEVGFACANVGTKDIRSVSCMTLSLVREEEADIRRGHEVSALCSRLT